MAAELQKAARNGNVRLVRQLLAKGGAPDSQDVDGWTCLHAAAVEGQVQVVRALCGEDICVVKESSSSHSAGADEKLQLDVGVSEEGADVGEALVNVNLTTACGRTALYFAAMIGSTECVRVLIRHGADPSISCKEGKTPLEVAELFERSEVQSMLQAAITCPRPPIKRRPKCTTTKSVGKMSDANEQVPPEKVVTYKPPEPSQWRKSDFTKWSKLTDEDLEAIDAHQQLCVSEQQHSQSKRIATAQSTASAQSNAHAGGVHSLPYGNGRIGPPKTLPPGHARYQDYKEWQDIQEDIRRRRRGEECKSGESERLISFKQPPEGGAAPDKNNGCHGVGYTWGQTPSEVQVWIVVAKGTRKEDITCEIAPAFLSVAVRKTLPTGKVRRDSVFKEARLWRRIKAEESVWTLEQGLLTLTLRKGASGWWRCVTDLEGHTKIGTMSQFCPCTRAMFRSLSLTHTLSLCSVCVWVCVCGVGGGSV